MPGAKWSQSTIDSVVKALAENTDKSLSKALKAASLLSGKTLAAVTQQHSRRRAWFAAAVAHYNAPSQSPQPGPFYAAPGVRAATQTAQAAGSDSDSEAVDASDDGSDVAEEAGKSCGNCAATRTRGRWTEVDGQLACHLCRAAFERALETGTLTDARSAMTERIWTDDEIDAFKDIFQRSGQLTKAIALFRKQFPDRSQEDVQQAYETNQAWYDHREGESVNEAGSNANKTDGSVDSDGDSVMDASSTASPARRPSAPFAPCGYCGDAVTRNRTIDGVKPVCESCSVLWYKHKRAGHEETGRRLLRKRAGPAGTSSPASASIKRSETLVAPPSPPPAAPPSGPAPPLEEAERRTCWNCETTETAKWRRIEGRENACAGCYTSYNTAKVKGGSSTAGYEALRKKRARALGNRLSASRPASPDPLSLPAAPAPTPPRILAPSVASSVAPSSVVDNLHAPPPTHEPCVNCESTTSWTWKMIEGQEGYCSGCYQTFKSVKKATAGGPREANKAAWAALRQKRERALAKARRTQAPAAVSTNAVAPAPTYAVPSIIRTKSPVTPSINPSICFLCDQPSLSAALRPLPLVVCLPGRDLQSAGDVPACGVCQEWFSMKEGEERKRWQADMDDARDDDDWSDADVDAWDEEWDLVRLDLSRELIWRATERKKRKAGEMPAQT